MTVTEAKIEMIEAGVHPMWVKEAIAVMLRYSQNLYQEGYDKGYKLGYSTAETTTKGDIVNDSNI